MSEQEKMTIKQYRELTENPHIILIDGLWFTKIPVKGYSQLKIFIDGLLEENKQLKQALGRDTENLCDEILYYQQKLEAIREVAPHIISVMQGMIDDFPQHVHADHDVIKIMKEVLGDES